MKSYVKITGPPLLKAIKALEKISIDMPQVCIWNTTISMTPVAEKNASLQDVQDYFHEFGPLNPGRCDSIISKGGESLGDYDFFFEWYQKPTIEEVNKLIQKIDEAFAPLGARYTLTTK